jgi:hypothetical protein
MIMQKPDLDAFSGGLDQIRTRRGPGRMLGGLAAVGAVAAAPGGDVTAGQ